MNQKGENVDKIENLTESQEAKLDFYFEKWKDIGLRFGPTSDGDRRKAEEHIISVYVNNSLKIPDIIWARSPNEAIKKLIELGDEKIKESPFGEAGFGQHDANWLGFYEFFRNEVGLIEETNELVPLMELAKYAGWWWPYENICVISEIPIFLSLDQGGNLHNTERSAIQYSDDFEIFYLNGIEMPQWLIVTAPEKLSIDRILALKNTEQRLMAIKKFGAHNMLDSLSGKSISKKGDEYELFEVTLEGQQEKLLKMKNPSEEKWHFEWVTPEIKTVEEALAYRRNRKKFFEPIFKT